jgi:hypothetical protein
MRPARRILLISPVHMADSAARLLLSSRSGAVGASR